MSKFIQTNFFSIHSLFHSQPNTKGGKVKFLLLSHFSIPSLFFFSHFSISKTKQTLSEIHMIKYNDSEREDTLRGRLVRLMLYQCVMLHSCDLKVSLDSRPRLRLGLFFFKPACYALFIGHEQ